MSLPNITVNLIRSNTPGNPQDLTGLPLVIGNCCMGPLNTVTQINQLSDLNQFGSGEGVEFAAGILNKAGSPVFFCRSLTTTPSTIGTITKTFANPVGTPVPSFGSVIAPGATYNGDVLIEEKSLGVTLTILNPGVLHVSTTIVVTGSNIVITLKHDGVAITETGAGLAAAITGTMAAAALVTATAIGTGASLCTALSLTALDAGALTITALTSGISYRVLLSGTSTPFGTGLSGGIVTVTLATDINGEPTTTAATAFTALQVLAAANPGVFTVAEVAPPSAGLLGAKASTVLPFGSTGTMTTAGTPCDRYDILVEIVKGGTIGGLTPILAIWSADGGANYTSQSTGVISPTGELLLQDSTLGTNITVTFAGTLDTGDMFSFSTTRPVTSSTDLIASLDAAIANTQFEWGYATSASSVNKATAGLLDGRLQAAFQNRFVYGIWNTRDIAEGTPGETETQWIASLINDYAGFNSFQGLTSIVAGDLLWNSPLTLRQWRRPDVFFACARNSSIPLHEALQKTNSDTATLPEVLDIYHDEFLSPGLDEQRFVTTRTYAISGVRGGKYITRGQTMSDPNNLAATKIHWNRIRLAISYNVKKYLFRYLGDQLQVIPVAESSTVPAGALAKTEADAIKAGVSAVIRLLLYKPKSDGKVSASDFTVEVPRNYNLLQTGNLIINGTVTPLSDVDQITFNLSLNLPV